MELVSLDQPLNGKAACQLACQGYLRSFSIRVHYVQMISVGRRRVWGSNEDKELPLPCPGETTTADMEISSLIATVHSINLKGTKELVVTLREVEELLKAQCQAEEDLRWIVYV